MVLLDTHIWVWWLGGNVELSEHEREELDYLASKRQIAISAISLWEAQMLVTKRRITISLTFDQWIREAARPDLVHIVPIDVNVAIALGNLASTYHGDPADRIIAASAISRDFELMTRDQAMLASGRFKRTR
ncbi:MAG: type II toxin-antitoxin system VapC family toxin [bacterium]|nr:type II toxin-antitoxin system VapC family toxin [bacterium]